MRYRYRHLSDGQLIGLHLLMQIAGTQYDAVRLSNRCLRSILDRQRIHDGVASEFARSLAPFFLDFKIEGRYTVGGGPANTLLLKPRPDIDPKEELPVNSIPAINELEERLGITINEFETERVTVKIIKNLDTEYRQVIKNLNTENLTYQVVKKIDGGQTSQND